LSKGDWYTSSFLDTRRSQIILPYRVKHTQINTQVSINKQLLYWAREGPKVIHRNHEEIKQKINIATECARTMGGYHCLHKYTQSWLVAALVPGAVLMHTLLQQILGRLDCLQQQQNTT
jgi:hypothetical protein